MAWPSTMAWRAARGFVQDDLHGVVLGVLADVEPLLEAEALVLQGVDEFVGHDRLLHVGVDPVEQIDGFVVGVIPSFDLLLVEAEHVLAEIEVAGQQAELFERQGGSVEAFAGSLLLEAVLDVFGDLVAGGQLLFDRVEDGKAGAFAGEAQDVVDGAEKFLGLGLGDVVLFGLRRRRLLRGGEHGERRAGTEPAGAVCGRVSLACPGRS